MAQKIDLPTRRYSAIAHTYLSIAAPLGTDVLDELLDVLRLPPQARILDVGCGGGRLNRLGRTASRAPKAQDA